MGPKCGQLRARLRIPWARTADKRGSKAPKTPKQTSWVQILTWPITSGVTLDKSFSSSVF